MWKFFFFSSPDIKAWCYLFTPEESCGSSFNNGSKWGHKVYTTRFHKDIIHSYSVCSSCLMLEFSHKDPHKTGQLLLSKMLLLSDYTDPFKRHFQATCLRYCSKEPKFPRCQRRFFPCPLQTTIHTKLIFSVLMSEGL